MARKDEILKAFLTDSLIEEKYGAQIKDCDVEKLTLSIALDSKIVIVKTIAILIDRYQNNIITGTNKDALIYKEIITYLNKAL